MNQSIEHTRTHAPAPSRIGQGTAVEQSRAAAGWDAVYLTDRAQWETRIPLSGPNLYTWDCASVLWLRPAYTVGRTVQVPAMASYGVVA